MTTDLVVIGGSWGGFEAVCHLLGALPGEISAPIVVALHRSPKSSNDALERMIRDCTRLDVVGVEDKRPLHDACIYVAPPDYHLLVEDGSLALSTEDVVQHARPSIDVLFESAADEYGAGVVGVLLTGANADGASGIRRSPKHDPFLTGQAFEGLDDLLAKAVLNVTGHGSCLLGQDA